MQINKHLSNKKQVHCLCKRLVMCMHNNNITASYAIMVPTLPILQGYLITHAFVQHYHVLKPGFTVHVHCKSCTGIFNMIHYMIHFRH